MALLSFVEFDTPSLPAQGEQRRSSYFNIPRGNSRDIGNSWIRIYQSSLDKVCLVWRFDPMSMNYMKHLFALPSNVPNRLRLQVDERFILGLVFIERSLDMFKKPISTSFADVKCVTRPRVD